MEGGTRRKSLVAFDIEPGKQGSVRDLPPELQELLPFQEFNNVQAACFSVAYQSDENCLISAPTGSGKTTLFELALFRALATKGSSVVVYLAPIKVL